MGTADRTLFYFSVSTTACSALGVQHWLGLTVLRRTIDERCGFNHCELHGTSIARQVKLACWGPDVISLSGMPTNDLVRSGDLS